MNIKRCAVVTSTSMNIKRCAVVTSTSTSADTKKKHAHAVANTRIIPRF